MLLKMFLANVFANKADAVVRVISTPGSNASGSLINPCEN